MNKKLFTVALISSLLVVGCGQRGKKEEKEKKDVAEKTSEKIEQVGVKETLHTKYFDVVVNESNFYPTVETGNEFSSLPAETGMNYLIINLTVKNISQESRLLTDGNLIIFRDGKEYKFEKSEHIAAKGFGLLKQINPLTSVTTSIVYKVPSDIQGAFYYNPSRSENAVIFLGSVGQQR